MICESIVFSIALVMAVHRYCQMREYMHCHSTDYRP